MRIAYLIPRLPASGPSRQLTQLCLGVHSRGMQVDVATLSGPTPDSPFEARLRLAGIEVQHLDVGRWNVANARRRVAAWLPTEPNTILHTQGIRPDFLSPRLNPTARVATVRNIANLDYPMTYGVWLGHLMALFHRRALRHFDRVVGVSDAVTADLRQNGLKGNCIPNAVDTYEFQPGTQEDREALRRELDIPSCADIAVSVGHLTQRKRPYLLAQAIAHLPSVHLVLLGEGPLGETLLDKLPADARERVHLLGRKENIRPYLQGADVYVSASAAEGLPNAVLEALASGLPCVLSDIEPHQEIVQTAPQAGYTVTPTDEKAFPEALAKCLAERVTASKAAREAAEKHFNLQRMVDQYLEIYEAALSERYA